MVTVDSKRIESLLMQQNKLLERLVKRVGDQNRNLTLITECMPDVEMTEKQKEAIRRKHQTLIELGVFPKEVEIPEAVIGFKDAHKYILWLSAKIRREQSFTGFDKEEWR